MSDNPFRRQSCKGFTFLIDIRRVIYHIHSVINTLLNRVSGSGMGTDTLLVSVGLINTCSRFFGGEITVFSVSDFCDLTSNEN